MSDIPTPPIPRPYRILMDVAGAREWVSSWGYDLNEAVLSACIKMGAHVGSDELKVCEITPDFEAYVKMTRGEYP